MENIKTWPNNFIQSLHRMIKGGWHTFSLSKWKVHFLHISSFLDLAIFHNKFNFSHSENLQSSYFLSSLISTGITTLTCLLAPHRFRSIGPDKLDTALAPAIIQRGMFVNRGAEMLSKINVASNFTLLHVSQSNKQDLTSHKAISHPRNPYTLFLGSKQHE